MNADFEQLKTTDPIVKKTLAAGGSLEDCIVALVHHAEELRTMCGDLERTATTLRPILHVSVDPPLREIKPGNPLTDRDWSSRD